MYTTESLVRKKALQIGIRIRSDEEIASTIDLIQGEIDAMLQSLYTVPLIVTVGQVEINDYTMLDTDSLIIELSGNALDYVDNVESQLDLTNIDSASTLATSLSAISGLSASASGEKVEIIADRGVFIDKLESSDATNISLRIRVVEPVIRMMATNLTAAYIIDELYGESNPNANDYAERLREQAQGWIDKIFANTLTLSTYNPKLTTTSTTFSSVTQDLKPFFGYDGTRSWDIDTQVEALNKDLTL